MKQNRFILTNINQYLNEQKIKSTNSFVMFNLLKTLPFIKYVEHPSGRFLHSIDLNIVDENNINNLNEFVDENNWYIERMVGLSFIITKKYVDEAKVDVPDILYHITPSENIESILKYGLKPKSDNLRHKYPLRIYVSDNISSLESISKEMKKRKGYKDYSIIKIYTKDLNISLYIDDTSAYKGHYYIQGIDVIPSENIELVKEFII